MYLYILIDIFLLGFLLNIRSFLSYFILFLTSSVPISLLSKLLHLIFLCRILPFSIYGNTVELSSIRISRNQKMTVQYNIFIQSRYFSQSRFSIENTAKRDNNEATWVSRYRLVIFQAVASANFVGFSKLYGSKVSQISSAR